MSTSRLGVSAGSRDPVPPPRRNLAAGKRLAPLPPGLRSRLRGGLSPSSSNASAPHGDVRQDLARTAPAAVHPPSPRTTQGHQPQQQQQQQQSRSFSKARTAGNALANSASPRIGGSGKDGRRYLPPVPPGESASGRTAASSMSSIVSGRRSAPADAEHSRRASNDSAPTTTATGTAPRTGPRASTSEGVRHANMQRDAIGGGGGGTAIVSVASARGNQQKPRAPTLTRAPDTATRSVRPSCAATAANPAAASDENARAAKNENEPSAAVRDAQKHVTVSDLPLAPHDADVAYYQDAEQWSNASELPPLVQSLLDGTALEAAYTTSLWTQAYPSPAELQPARTTALTATPPSADALPLPFQHREEGRRLSGFYACVRCSTPICSPANQVIPAAAALRGIAVFTRLNLDGVEMRVRMAGLEGRRRSLLSNSAAHISAGAVNVSSSSSGGVQLLVHCCHCGGCLGVMLIADVAVAPAATTAPTAGGAASRGTQGVPTYTQELLCANSVCLQYQRYSTRAPLDGELLGRSSSVHPASGRGGGGAPMAALFAPPRRTAWGGTNDEDDGDAGVAMSDRDSAESSLGDLLEALNPYSGGGGYDSD